MAQINLSTQYSIPNRKVFIGWRRNVVSGKKTKGVSGDRTQNKRHTGDS
jgi:hypothetical protein